MTSTELLLPGATGLHRAAVHRIACAVVAVELRRLRSAGLPRGLLRDWTDDTPIGDEGLGLDSMEQLGALGALAEMFGLDDSRLGDEPPGTVGDWVDWILSEQASGEGRMTVRTSGSTGAPRPCIHATADLVGEAAFLAERFAGRRRVVALVPAHHLYGIIWTAMLPAMLDIPVVARTLGASLALRPGDLVVAVPDQWAALVRLAGRFPEDVVGVSSAAPLDDALAETLLLAGLRDLVDVYGSSETGGIALRSLPATDYQLMPRWSLQAGDAGLWCVADRRGLVADLPDHIERTGDRSLRPVGRRDGAVQVAGHNVWPERVAAVLRSVDGVAEAAVRLGANGRLRAFLVPRTGADPAHLIARAEHAVATRLTEVERPKSFATGPALPRNAMGKLEDWS